MGPGDPTAEPTGELIGGRHRLHSVLARGAMGEVHLATDTLLDRQVALKRMRPDAMHAAANLDAFRAEYRALKELQHPRIIEVYSYGIHRHLPYYTMELLDGEDLRKLAPLPPTEACRCLRDVASSVALVHARGMLHRDLSPRNVRRTSDGQCKLLDFGTMIPMGMPPNVAGTPPLLAPEAMRRVALDARADLYSLGALGYWLLTGRHAYDVRRLQELPEAWKLAPPTTRRFNDAISPGLDDLILSLLDHNPLARPVSAAEVIERLTGVADLPPDTSPEIAASYLARTAMVGRHDERAELETRIARAASGRGGALRVQAQAGMGKSRLLQDAQITAELHGLRVLAANGGQAPGDGGLVIALGRALQGHADALALDSSAVALQALDQLQRPVEGTHAARSWTELVSSGRQLDAAGTRAQLQSVLGAWFTDVARRRPLLVAVDDLARADEFSSAFVTALAAEAQRVPILVVATHGPDPEQLRSPAFTTFCELAHRLPLAPLDDGQTQALVASSFGAVPHTDQVATWVFRNANGNPAMSIELLRHLAENGVARFVAGAWVLPGLPIDEEAPQELRRALAVRLARLPAEARLLTGLLAVHGGSAPQAILENASGLRAAAGAALALLLQQGVLEVVGEHLTFKLASMRAAIAHDLDPEATRDLHARLAGALLRGADEDAGRLLAAGWHLSHTTEELRGAHILATEGPRLLRDGVSADTAAAAMERALEIYERHGQPLAQCLRLRSHLTYAGYTCDERLAHRYGKATVEALYRASGTDRATRWARRVPAPLAVAAAALWTSATRLFIPARHRPPNVVLSLTYFLRAATALAGIGATNLDRDLTAWVAKRTHILSASRVPDLVVAALTCDAFAVQPLGSSAALRRALERALSALASLRKLAKWRGGFMPLGMEDLHTGLLLSQGINECYRAGPGALAFAESLDARHTPLATTCAERVRMVYYTVRGHREEAERARHLIELRGIQGGSTWQVNAFSLPIEGMSGAMHGDVVMCRRALEQLEKRVLTTPALRPMLDMVRVGYHYARCDYARAVELGEVFAAENPPGSLIGWNACYGAIALSMFDLGHYQRCLEFADAALSDAIAEDLEFVTFYATLEGARAMAMTMLGRTQQARQSQLGLIARLSEHHEHTYLAMTYDYQARAARRRGDTVELARALSAMSAAAARSGSPALIAAVQRIAGIRQRTTARTELGAPGHELTRHGRADVPTPRRGAAQSQAARDSGKQPAPEVELVTQVLDACPDGLAKARQALRIMAQTVGARDGYLFLATKAGPDLAATLTRSEPPVGVEQAVRAHFGKAGAWDQYRVVVDAAGHPAPTAPSQGPMAGAARTFLFVPLGEAAGQCAALAALEVESAALVRIQPRLVEQVGNALSKSSVV